MKQTVLKLNLICLAFICVSLRGQNSFLEPGDDLVLEGIPRISSSLAADVARYSHIRGATMPEWHPVRREMLIQTQFADTLQIHQVLFPGGARTQLTFFDDPVQEPSYQPTTGNFFVFAKDRSGDENYQFYRYDSADGAVTLLTDGKSRNTDGIWSNGGDRFVYSSNRRDGKDADLWLMNPADPASDHLLGAMDGEGWRALDFSPDDRQLLLCNQLSVSESYLWLFDIATGKKTLLTPKQSSEPVVYAQAQFDKDCKGIYTTTDQNSEVLRLAYIDLETGRRTYLVGSNWNVEKFRLSPDGRTIGLVVNEEGWGRLRLFDTARRKERKCPVFPPGIVYGLKWHNNSRDLALTFTSAQNSSDIYSVDVKTARVERWTTSETGGIKTQDFLEPELVHWQSFDGLKLSGWLYRPPSKFTGKRPVIIDIHGGPESQARPSFRQGTSYLVNELGITVVQPNVRGSLGWGKTFLNLDNGLLRENCYRDLKALLDWIESRPDLDSNRIMVMGGSYGGYLTLAVASFYSDRIRCALDVCGQSSLATFLDRTSAYRQELRRAEYGNEQDPNVRDFLNRIAPLNHADQITKPLFVVQGANDPRVPASEAGQIVHTVREHNTPVWYLLAKDEGHGMTKKKNEDFLLAATVLFAKQYLLP